MPIQVLLVRANDLHFGAAWGANLTRPHCTVRTITASVTIPATMARKPTASIFFMGHIG